MNLKDDIYLESVKVTAFIFKDGDNYVIHSDGEGGTIVSDVNKEKAEAKFDEAIRASFALRNLIFYRDIVREIEKENESRHLKTPKIEIEFVEA